jgi:cytochrome c oxidase subunit 3
LSLYTAYAALGAGALLWVFLVTRLRARSWLTKGSTGAVHEGGETSLTPQRIGLITFLGVITSLFGLFITAYHMRMMDGMEHGDWVHFPVPKLLWFNTAVLMLGSVAMQWARGAAERGEFEALRARLIAGGLLTGGFLVLQLGAWRELGDAGYLSARNPAVAFFYLLTAVHGLHLVGGLAVWARTLTRLAAPVAPAVRVKDVRQVVALCTLYWHYLLLVWLVLFALMLST